MAAVDLSSIIFLLLFLAFLAPMVAQRLLSTRRYRAIRKLETARGSRVITMIHRQESISLLGIPLRRFIDVEDSEQVLRAIRLTPDTVPIDLVVHTPGGLVLAAEQISRALHKHPAKVTVLVPHYAMSGGTLLALAADEIVMDDNAVLGPVDPQIGQWPAASIIKAVEQKPVERVNDETLILADISRKAMTQIREFVAQQARGRLSRRSRERAGRAAHLGTVDARLPAHDRPAHAAWPAGQDRAAARGLRPDGPLPAGRKAAAVRAVRADSLPRAGGN